MYATARHRTETRGMHKRADFPELDSQQQRRLITSGLERILVRPENSSQAVLGTGPVNTRSTGITAQPGAAP
jgi:succinate dehydrogenase/fumarate reductase flavoprotein subunit